MTTTAAGPAPTALVAEDEPRLARALERQLADAWPALRLLGTAPDGLSATTMALELLPEVLFLDIRMPGRSGLEAAEAIADDWPEDRPAPLLVFVTAYDEFAVAAFERAAIDYLLKPVTPERLAQAVARLQERLAGRRGVAEAGEQAALLQDVQSLGAPAGAPEPPLRILRAGLGNTVKMIAVADVLCFEATDKYVNVVTADGEALVRMSLRELAARLDDPDFVQVHRSVLVNTRHVLSATRDDAGHYSLQLRGLARTLKVSRAFSHRFRPM